MSGKYLGHVFLCEWGNPYTQPPNGQPRLLAEIFVPNLEGHGVRSPAAIHEFMDHCPIAQLGKGYTLKLQAIHGPEKSLPPETLARMRQQRAQKRIQAKYPLFAGQFVQEEIERKPDYYIEGRSDWDVRRDAIFAAEEERRLRYLAHPNELIIYWK